MNPTQTASGIVSIVSFPTAVALKEAQDMGFMDWLNHYAPAVTALIGMASFAVLVSNVIINTKKNKGK